jgi:hypothetical protein
MKLLLNTIGAVMSIAIAPVIILMFAVGLGWVL